MLGGLPTAQPLPLASISARSQNNHLLVAHTFWGFKAINPYVTKVRSENLATLGESLSGDDEDQNPAAGGQGPAHQSPGRKTSLLFRDAVLAIACSPSAPR